MKERIGFVAIGQAGGNIGKELEDAGFKVLFLNTSTEDLKTLDTKHKYHITGGEGCNKDRKKAKQVIVEDFDNICYQIESRLGKMEMLFAIFSCGGGTGSGAGPMFVDLMADEGIKIGSIVVLPGLKESAKAQMNAYDCLKELTSIKNMACTFILDNSNGDKFEINRLFADSFKRFITIPETDNSVEGNIDKAEIIETLSSFGMIKVVKSNAGDTAGLINDIKNSIYAAGEEQAIKYITYSTNIRLDEADMFAEFGTPLDVFYTKNEENSIIALAGLGFPMKRFDDIKNVVNQSKDTILSNLKAPGSIQLADDVNYLNDFDGFTSKVNEKPKSKRDIMNKYLR